MATIRRAPAAPPRANPIVLYNLTTGGDRTIDRRILPWFTPLADKLGFRVWEEQGSVKMQAKGFVLNSADLQQRARTRQAIRDRRARIEAYFREIDGFREAATTRVQRLNDSVLDTFIESVRSWPEVIDAGKSGTSLTAVPLKFDITVESVMGLRFWPVLVSVRQRQRKWVLCAPIGFRFGTTGVHASSTAHPHVHGGLTLCAGDAAREPYGGFNGNPFHDSMLLREWYVGYREGDQANGGWVSTARNFWQQHGEAFFKSCEEAGIEPKYLEAPWAGGNNMEVKPLTREIVQRFTAAGTGEGGWASGSPETGEREPLSFDLLTEMGMKVTKRTLITQPETGDHIMCAVPNCGSEAHVHTEFVSPVDAADGGAFNLCLCHSFPFPGRDAKAALAVAHANPYQPPYPLYVYTMVGDEPDTLRFCEHPVCGDPWCEEHPIVATKHRATHLIIAPGHRTWAVCNACATEITKSREFHVTKDRPETGETAPTDITPRDASTLKLTELAELLAGLGTDVNAIEVKFGDPEQITLETVCRACGKDLGEHEMLECPVVMPPPPRPLEGVNPAIEAMLGTEEVPGVAPAEFNVTGTTTLDAHGNTTRRRL